MKLIRTYRIFGIFVVSFAINSIVPTQVITMEEYWACIAFYLLVFLATIFIASRHGLPSYQAYLSKPFASVSSGAIFIHLLLAHYVQSALYFEPAPINPNGASFLLMNGYFVLAKPFDVLAQQALIFTLFHKLVDRQKSLRQIQVIFVIVFGIPHIFQTLLTDPFVGLGFAFASIGAAVIFPILLRNPRLGAAFCFTAHLFAYSAAAVFSWSIFNILGLQ